MEVLHRSPRSASVVQSLLECCHVCDAGSGLFLHFRPAPRVPTACQTVQFRGWGGRYHRQVVDVSLPKLVGSSRGTNTRISRPRAAGCFTAQISHAPLCGGRKKRRESKQDFLVVPGAEIGVTECAPPPKGFLSLSRFLTLFGIWAFSGR